MIIKNKGIEKRIKPNSPEQGRKEQPFKNKKTEWVKNESRKNK